MYVTRSKSNKVDDEERRRYLAAAAASKKAAGSRADEGTADQPMSAAAAMASRTHILAYEQPASPSEGEHSRTVPEGGAVSEAVKVAQTRDAVTARKDVAAAGAASTGAGGVADGEVGVGPPREAPAVRPATTGENARAPSAAPSIRSCASVNTIAARKKRAELRAAQEIAAIEKRLIMQQLETELQEIDAEADESPPPSRAPTPRDPIIEPTSRVDEWISSVNQRQEEEAAGRPRGEDRQRLARDRPLAPPRAERAPSPREPRHRVPTPTRNVRLINTHPGGYRDVSPVEPRAASPPGQIEYAPMYRGSRERDFMRSSAEPPSDAATAFNRLAEQLKESMRPRPPKQVYELPYFSGDPGEWLLFYNAYRETTARYGYSNYENMARLRNCLKGDAKQCVQHLLAASSQPELVIRLLKKNFGRTDLLIDKALDELKKLPHVGPSAADLNNFSTKVVNIVSTLVDLDKKNYADNPLLIREITDRLSPHLRSRWCQFAREQMGSQGAGELMLLANFLLEESDAELEYSHAKAAPRRSTGTGPLRNDYRSSAPARGATRKVPIHRTYAVQQDPCLCCGGKHRTSECRKIIGMSIRDRWDWARNNQMCYKCLDKRHRRDQCKAKGCGVPGCQYGHHRLLHQERVRTNNPPTHPEVQENNAPRAEQSCTSEVEDVNATVLLQIIPVTVEGPRKTIDTFALMDGGSTVSLADEDLVREIGAVGVEAPLHIRGVGSMATANEKSQKVKVTLKGKSGGPLQTVSVRTVRALGLRGQHMNDVTRYAHLSDLRDACYAKAVPRILIGADNWHLMMPLETRIGKQNEPAAIRTQLGWVVFGTTPRSLAWRSNETTLHCHLEDQELNSMIKQYFNIDSIGIKNIEKKRPEHTRAEEIFEATIKKVNRNGPRYEVGQIWRDDEFKLPPSYGNALTRLRGIERKMDRDPEYAERYTAQINNLLEKGYAEKISELPASNKTWIIPHFAVTNENKPGKLRIVFDCACACQGVSLNDFILEGPDLLQSLMGILFRFREGRYAVVADLQEMFLQIKLREEDQPSQLFLWRGTDRVGPPQIYKMSSILFGAASSPFIAHSVRNRNARDNAQQYPAAVEEITRNHYMDDFVSSFNTEQELIDVAQQVDASHAQGGFRLRGWTSNSKRFLDKIPPELKAKDLAQLGHKENKILGLMWDARADTLGFNTNVIRVPDEVKQFTRAPTKRETLSAVMSIYDPLGLLSHYTITAKLLLQKIWSLKLDWDAPLPSEERQEFEQWLRALEGVARLRVPRPYDVSAPDTERQLHIFVDGSMKAYACVAYWRIEDRGNVNVSLVAAKAKVAPVKQLSVPRIELQAALAGARMMNMIKQHHRYKINKIVLWTDSRTVLHWVRNDARRYSTYVAHRLGEIAEITEVNQWRWIPTKQNPADQATRPDPNKIVKYDSMWYKGPTFLYKAETEWPIEHPYEADERLINLEEQTCATHEGGKINQAPLPELERFSNYDKLINTTARVFQFIERLKTRKYVEFQAKHRAAAEHLWQQWAQRVDFADELLSLRRGEPISKKSKIYMLDPVLEEDGLLRMRGRINAAPVQGLEKRPVILNGRNRLVRLLVLKAHQKAAHANNEMVINNLRQQYWILHLRPTVRKVAFDCQLCKIKRARPAVPIMGDLPLARIEPYKRAFTNTAVDLFGPIMVTIGRRHEKRWVALFTCLSTRAVHLEIVGSLSTDSAIMALRRMAARRGWPAIIYSDNGTNLRGANDELRRAYNEWLPALRDYGVRHNMRWRFIPPGAPNQGGAWERLVRSVKTALAATLHTRAPREEVLQTLLAEAENTVNTRPLTHVSVDHRDEEALTPSHFLLGGSTGLPPTGQCDEADRRTWRASQALADHFWSRWVREYLPTLAPRQGSDNRVRPLQPNDCVIITDPNLPRNVWPRGIVEEVFPGPDGNVRSANVKTKGGVFRRPVTRLAVLPIRTNHS